MREGICAQVSNCNRNVSVSKDAICRIVSDGLRFNAAKPFSKTDTYNGSTGTGFFMRGVEDEDGAPLLITAYHCVTLALTVKVTVEVLSADYMDATLVGANPKLDIALMRIVGVTSQNKAKIPMLEAGNSDDCFTAQRIQAVGFALGMPWMQFTVGVVSGRTNVHLQIDAAINGGNSGGPVFDDNGQVIGIVLAGMDRAQNVNYMCPIQEAMISIRRVLSSTSARPVCIDNASLNANLTKISSPWLKANSVTCEGMLVSSLITGSPLSNAGIRAGDVLCSLDNYQIDMQGRIMPKGWWPDKLPVMALLERTGTDKTIPVSFWSIAEQGVKRANVKLEKDTACFRTIFPEFATVPYTAYGGIVVQPLTKTLLVQKEFLSLYVLINRPELFRSSILIVTAILPESPFDVMQNITPGDVVLSVNSVPVSTIEDYIAAIQLHSQSDVMSIGMRSGNVASALRQDVHTANEQIRKRLGDAIHL